MSYDYSALIAQAAEQGPDVNEATAGGGNFDPPAAGLARLRLIEYIEIGEHMTGKKGEEKRKPMARLLFELSGPKHPAREVGEGDNKKLIPHTIKVDLVVSTNEKANYYKLFKRMNWQGTHKIFPQMLGEEFLGTVVIVTKGEGTDKRVYANLRDEGGFTIRPPFVEDPDTGESRRVTADPVLSPIRCFMWDFCDKPMWDALFIDGSWDAKTDKDGNVIEEGRSKNWIQNLIKSALNFDGSPICNLLCGGDALNMDLPDATTPERSDAAKEASADLKAGAAPKEPANDPDDPLAGVGGAQAA